MIKNAVEVSSHGKTLKGFFHCPEHVEGKPIPLVVMLNGYATEWHFGTESFIRAFTDAGYATLNVDYRGFGESEGEPRQVVDIPGQLEDARAIINHALAQDWVDKNKLVIWGSSLGGGHAISMAAEFRPAVLIAQVPHCCSRAAMKTVSLAAILKGMSLALLDQLLSLFGAGPVKIPVVAEPGDYGVMSHKGWKAGYLQIAEASKTWENAIPARSLIKGGDYRPIMVAGKIDCPALLIAANQDAGVPVDVVKDTVEKMPHGQFEGFDGDHFDVYHGEKQPAVLQKELEFLQQHL